MTKGTTNSPARSRGRPRDEEKDVAISQATWQILAEKGYEGLTFEAVAELAGCSRSTLYRRFSNKVDLVEATLSQTSRRVEPKLDSSLSPRQLLIAHTTALSIYMSGPRGPATLMMSVSAANHPDLAAALHRYSEAERQFYLREMDRLRPDGLDPKARDFALDTLIGTVIFHVAVLRTELTPSRIAALVDSAIALLDSE